MRFDRKMQLLLFVLELVEPVVNAALREKLLVSALLAEPAFVKHQDAVGVLNGAQPVGNHKRGPSGEQAVQRFADLQFCFGIHAGSGFVQNKEARIVRQGAGEINELPLSN